MKKKVRLLLGTIALSLGLAACDDTEADTLTIPIDIFELILYKSFIGIEYTVINKTKLKELVYRYRQTIIELAESNIKTLESIVYE